MKKLAAIAITFIFLASATDAVPLAGYWSAEYKCPRCKMKMERKGDCPCHKKNRTTRAIIHDPCGDNEGDFHISFDRLSAVLSVVEIPLTTMQTERFIFPSQALQSYVFEVITPPPRA